jgi:opacity protein-like surface antigen
MGCVAALALLWGLSSAACAANVAVTVSGGAVVASPEGVTLAATEDSLVFQLGTAGYTFPSANAVVITGTGSSFKCTTAASKTSVTCKKTGQGNGSQQTYQINVLPSGSSTPLESPPNIWISSE